MKLSKSLFGWLSCLTFWVSSFQLAVSAPSFTPQATGLADGAGMWMNLWNYPVKDPEAYCVSLQASSIKNVFVQTSRSNTCAIAHPENLGPLLDACHRHGLRVIAWSFTDLANPISDANKLVTAAEFVSLNGEHIDGVAADMEIGLGVSKIEQFSRTLRTQLGANYPLIAIVFSPLNRAPQNAYTPWKLIGQYFDVIAPMTYWSGKSQNLDPYTYTTQTVQSIRRLVGRSDIEVHPIGDGMHATSDGIRQFLKACHDTAAASASLYPNQKPSAEQLAVLSNYNEFFPGNSRFRFAAYKELRRANLIPEPAHADPSQPISHADFVKALACAVTNTTCYNLTSEDAYRIVSNKGVYPELTGLADFLSRPVNSQEAVNVIANLVNDNPHQIAKRPSVKRKRAGSWLIQPAYAETTPGTNHSINYLDAALLIFQAQAALSK